MSTTRTAVPVVTLRNGVDVPWLGFGSGTALYSQDAEGPTTRAVQAGFTHLDCAQAYNNESMGTALARLPRKSFFLTTKLAALKPGESALSSLKASLARLRVSYVDLFLIHDPTQHLARLKEVWKELEDAHDAGLARSIGVSNFTVPRLDEVVRSARIVPHVNQIEVHPNILAAARPILEYDAAHGITTAAYGGLGPLVRAPPALGALLERVRADLEKRHGAPVSKGQVCMLWVRAKVPVVITTTSKEERMREYLAVSELPPLTEEEVAALDEEGEKVHVRRYMSHCFA